MFQPPTTDQILDRLAHQKPVPEGVIRAQIRLRWAVTLGLALLLPGSVLLATFSHSWAWRLPAGATATLAMVGLVAIGIGWAANRRQGVDVQWGMAALKETEIEEFVTLAAKHPAIEKVVSDAWLSTWIVSGNHLLGRDLLLLRRCVRQYEAALTRPHRAGPPSTAASLTP
jgi:hypothetical protein